MQRRALLYDKGGEEHYNVISAFIKSMRGSDPDAALYWLARMLEAGEDPLFIARRMVIFASEDIGNADPSAVQVAVAVKDAFHFVGMPEGVDTSVTGSNLSCLCTKEQCLLQSLYLEALNDVKEKGAMGCRSHQKCANTPDERSWLWKGVQISAQSWWPYRTILFTEGASRQRIL